MVTAFKTNKYLKEIRTVLGGIKINCNARAVTTNKIGKYRGLKVWYIPDGIVNIFSMHELEKMFCITYDSCDGFYVVHTPKGHVQFYKDEQGLPYINLEQLSKAAVMLLHWGQEATEANDATKGTLLVQTVHGNFEGYTKSEILQAKEACRAQAMIRNPNEKDYKGMISSNMRNNCPISASEITNAQNIFGPDLASIRGKLCTGPLHRWWWTMWLCRGHWLKQTQ
jgi:hypothetical protein